MPSWLRSLSLFTDGWLKSLVYCESHYWLFLLPQLSSLCPVWLASAPAPTNSSRGPSSGAEVLRALWLVNAENGALWLVSGDHDQCGRPCDQILRAQRLQASRNILLKAVSLIREKLLVESDSQNLDTDVTILHVLPAHRQISRESSYQSQRDTYVLYKFIQLWWKT